MARGYERGESFSDRPVPSPDRLRVRRLRRPAGAEHHDPWRGALVLRMQLIHPREVPAPCAVGSPDGARVTSSDQ